MNEEACFAAVDESRPAQRLEVLRGVRQRNVRFRGQRLDGPLTLRKQLEKFDATGTRQRLAEMCELPVETFFELPVRPVRHSQVINRLLDYYCQARGCWHRRDHPEATRSAAIRPE